MQSGPEKSVHIQNREDFIKEGVKTSKNRSEGPESVQYNRLIIKEGCSVLVVLLYSQIITIEYNFFYNNTLIYKEKYFLPMNYENKNIYFFS